MLADGRDPIGERREIKLAMALDAAKRMTFAQCRDAYIDAHAPSWRNEKHAAQRFDLSFAMVLTVLATDIWGLPPHIIFGSIEFGNAMQQIRA